MQRRMKSYFLSQVFYSLSKLPQEGNQAKQTLLPMEEFESHKYISLHGDEFESAVPPTLGGANYWSHLDSEAVSANEKMSKIKAINCFQTENPPHGEANKCTECKCVATVETEVIKAGGNAS